jgi:hypothetical protein
MSLDLKSPEKKKKKKKKKKNVALDLTTTYSSDYHLQSIDQKPIYTKPQKIGTIGVRTHLQRRQNHRISDLPSPVAYTPNKHHKSKDKRPIYSMEQK